MTKPFLRCTFVRGGHRCWLGPHDTKKKHLILIASPPSLAQIEKIISVRPDIDRETLFQAILHENSPPPPPTSSEDLFDEVFADTEDLMGKIWSLFFDKKR